MNQPNLGRRVAPHYCPHCNRSSDSPRAITERYCPWCDHRCDQVESTLDPAVTDAAWLMSIIAQLMHEMNNQTEARAVALSDKALQLLMMRWGITTDQQRRLVTALCMLAAVNARDN